eukprot:CAMPEP_0197183264 /NCGR_PEP_ID=MMETSP1423-20130617/7722_1 /TAXON_ID=476441 /ORGANISM="Pseudo-nitzschia heimii, Strain UNC1101" /LENGTH=566 /DNA_ID=CAMNT_0042633825 /DNA_START=68 /DNA_END=1768 /DNA_ORIENTATION=+
MPALPPVADPTASMPPRSTGVLPSSTPAVVPNIASSTAAPPPPRASVLSAGVGGRPVAGLGTQAPTPMVSVKTSSKSKKKSAGSVTMATAATAQSSGGQGGSSGENTGRWTAEEHNLFLQGLELHGKGWKKIAGLIKSRTVVQIRTHAQKYFQKLAKAKQNGEDVTMAGGGSSNGGAVVGSTMTMMMGDCGRSSLNGGSGPNAGGSALSSASGAGVGHGAAHTNKRRKQTSGTKRKAIQSVVASARRNAKKKGAGSSIHQTRYEQPPNGTTPTGTLNPIIDSVAPALAPYVLPTPLSSMGGHQTATAGASNTTAPGVIGVTALEDSLFRFLTPAPVVPPETQVNPVARQAGANPITLPTDQPGLSNTLAGGEVSPTGVNDLELYPTWTDYSKDTPSWYSKGSDVDALLDVADTLDWLADTGDLTETYEEAEQMHAATSEVPSQSSDFHFAEAQPQKDVAPTSAGNFYSNGNDTTTMSMNTLPRIDSGTEVNVPPLPSLFDGNTDNAGDPVGSKNKLSLHMSTIPSVTNLDENLFSSPMEEHDFVSTILDETGAGSSDTLAALGATP